MATFLLKFYGVILIYLTLFLKVGAQDFTPHELKHWEEQAARITIIRDTWGVPHIYGKTDADAAFGLMYAQCEDNYWQIEDTYVRVLGRSGELYGETGLESDALVAMFECRQKGKKSYADADVSLQRLCDAAASGLNFFLHKNPGVEKRLLTRYQPWFFLVAPPLNPSGHGVTQAELKNVYTKSFQQIEGNDQWMNHQQTGSNAMALSRAKSKSGNSMLLINPHVSFFGSGQRYEAHLISEQPSLKDAGKGLNISGFAMLGTFYIWSGFTENTGWAHTNTGSDYEDVYLEKFDHPADSLRYHYGTGYKRATIWKDTLFYKSGNEIKKKIFEFRKTHRGPLIAKRDSLWITMRSAAENPALYVLQSWRMCRAKNLKEFTAAMGHVQLTTNTMYADRSGNIAYWHGNAIPRRNESFDWKLPVDGSNPLTEWQGIHSLNEIIHVVNPASGWIQNCNATPFKSAGQNSPVKKNYPAYMSYEDQNYRADEAIRLLMQPGKFSFSEFGDWVTSNHLPMMEGWLPQILKAFDAQPKKIAEQHVSLKHAADTLRKWDYRYATGSKATTLAVFWYRSYLDWVKKQARGRFYGDYSGLMIYAVKLPAPDSVAVALLSNAVDSLRSKYGTEFISWGDINRLQRIHSSGSLEKFDDNKFSLPVDAVPSGMGSLFAFQTRTDPGQKKMYGVAGNTYTAIIEFGKKIQAKSIVTFGQSANPGSPHYFDQASLYAAGEFKDVYFYKKDVMKHARRKYHPGE